MPSIIVRQLTFGYEGVDQNVFSQLNLTIDMAWRACLVGHNGRGKSTLLRLIQGELMPDSGVLECPRATQLFDPPSQTRAQTSPSRQAQGLSALAVAKQAAGPFADWELRMQEQLAEGSDQALQAYSELQETYERAGGYEIEANLQRELQALQIDEAHSLKPFAELSSGQQTRCLLASLFVRPDTYPLIDEPTNHLDLAGRDLVADYLHSKPGFLLVSHDRAFLDRCVSHVVALNPDTIDVQRTSFSQWRQRHYQQLQRQAADNKQLKKEIQGFEQVAAQRRSGANKREADKTAHTDKGFIGARAARQMKRALAAEQRATNAAADRRATLADVQKSYPLKIPIAAPSSQQLITANNLVVWRAQPLFKPVSFRIEPGMRLSLQGPNGSGKSSLLRFLTGAGEEQLKHEGSFACAAQTSFAWSQQNPRWRTGLLAEHLQKTGLDQAAFRQIMAALGVRGSVLDQPLQTLSPGQRKKIELARSLAQPADVVVWDEPLNFLDIDTRERIEAAVLAYSPTLLFCEHDATFVHRIATHNLVLAPAAPVT